MGLQPYQKRTWANIDLDAAKHNYRIIQNQLNNGTKLCCVVKANGYGHGAVQLSKLYESLGADYLAVSNIEEAIQLRNNGIHIPILILGYTDPQYAKALAEYNIIQTVVGEDHAKALLKKAKSEKCTVRVHVALDTGMNRLGFLCRSEAEIDRTVTDIEKLSSLAGLDVQGIFTHFAKADEIEGEDSLTDRQISRFKAACSALEEKNCCPATRHASNSAAIVRFGGLGLEYVRAGIVLYGARPSEDTDAEFLRTVMKLKTVVAHIHKLSAGETVSYGGIFKAEREMTVATLPVGYADGFIRAYGGAFVTVETESGERKAPVIGRICMDQCMIDVSGINCKTGDTVRLFGGDPRELYDLAARAETIDYECLCLVSARVPRVYKN